MSLSINNISSVVSKANVIKNATKGLEKSMKRMRFDDNNIKNKIDLVCGYKATDIYGNIKEVFKDGNKVTSTRIDCADGRKYILSKDYFYSKDLKGREYTINKTSYSEVKKSVDIKNKDGSGYGYSLYTGGRKMHSEWKTNPDGSGNIKEYYPNGVIRSNGILSHFNVEISHKDYTSTGKEIIY